jgi:GxxExxY protein
MIVDDRVIVELKAGAVLGPTDKRQLVNYLRATTLDVGLLLHYGPDPKFYRLVSPRVLRADES